jgi:carbon monoxide dehydrogenase subunit G
MGRQAVRGSITINAPIEYVWEVVNDPATFVEGIDWVFEAQSEGEGPLGVGSVYVERAKPGLREGTYRWEITAMDAPHRAVHSHSSGEIEIDLEVTCEALDATSTRYTQVMEYRALPAFRPLGYILERTVMKRQMQKDFDEMILPNYKRIVEQRYQSQ